MSKKTNRILFANLKVASTFWARGKGLLGRSGLEQGEAIWIYRCNSIHTFFMKFSIDCVFVDQDFRVIAIIKNVDPWRLVPPVWGASSVIEMAAGKANALNLRVGDQFYVGN